MRQIFLHTISVIGILLLTACHGTTIDTNMSEKLADFEFTTQDNESFSPKDLEGEWWVTYFMYTSCTMVCPTTTPNLLNLQQELQAENLKFPIVAFSVDPDVDTPNVLKEYAQNYEADLDQTTFLTGYDFTEIQKLSNESFKEVLENGGTGEMEIVHTTQFFLINPKGEIVKKYDGISQEEIDVLRDDLTTVLD